MASSYKSAPVVRMQAHVTRVLRRKGWVLLFMLQGKRVWVGPKGELETQTEAFRVAR